MLGKWKAKLKAASKKFAGKTAFLDAVTASCALVAAADGTIDDSEVEATLKAIKANEILSSAFSASEISKSADQNLERANSGRTGRAQLYAKIQEGATDPESAEIVYLAALDVAEAEGDVGADEKAVLKKIAERIGVNEAAMDV